MPKFTYTARDRSGQTVQAALDAPHRKDVLRLLAARGLHPLKIEEGTAGAARPSRPATKTTATAKNQPRPAAAPDTRAAKRARAVKLTRRERLPFFQALHDLITSGLSAGESIRLLSVRIQEPLLRTLCAGLWERLGEGASLSQALTAYPAVFDPASVNLIQAGEATGNLAEVLERLITHLTEQKEMRRQFLAAMSYPAFLFVVCLGVIGFFLFFLLPRLQSLFNSLGGELPLSTRILVNSSHFALHYGLFVIGGLVFAAISFWRWRATPAGREKSDAWLISLPLVGPLIVNQTVFSLSQTLSVLLENGINATEALRMTEKQIANTVHRQSFQTAIDRILEGESLSTALQRTDFLPPLALDQLAVGENTGSVVPSLKKIAAAYRNIITDQLRFFTSIITNGVLLGVFSFVGFIGFALVSAVFKLSSSFSLH